MIEYRPAEPTEFDQVVELARRFHNASVYSRLEFSPGRMVDLLSKSFLTPEAVRAFIAVDGGEVIGGYLATAQRIATSDDIIAQEIFIGVRPDYYEKGVGARLIDDFNGWARAIGAKMAVTCSSLGVDNARADAFFTRHGFERFSSEFVRWVDGM